MMYVNCPRCNTRLHTPDSDMPLKLRCPACKYIFHSLPGKVREAQPKLAERQGISPASKVILVSLAALAAGLLGLLGYLMTRGTGRSAAPVGNVAPAETPSVATGTSRSAASGNRSARQPAEPPAVPATQGGLVYWEPSPRVPGSSMGSNEKDRYRNGKSASGDGEQKTDKSDGKKPGAKKGGGDKKTGKAKKDGAKTSADKKDEKKNV